MSFLINRKSTNMWKFMKLGSLIEYKFSLRKPIIYRSVLRRCFIRKTATKTIKKLYKLYEHLKFGIFLVDRFRCVTVYKSQLTVNCFYWCLSMNIIYIVYSNYFWYINYKLLVYKFKFRIFWIKVTPLVANGK